MSKKAMKATPSNGHPVATEITSPKTEVSLVEFTPEEAEEVNKASSEIVATVNDLGATYARIITIDRSIAGKEVTEEIRKGRYFLEFSANGLYDKLHSLELARTALVKKFATAHGANLDDPTSNWRLDLSTMKMEKVAPA